MSEYPFLENDGVVSWKSKKQSTVAHSTTEAEYMALSTAIQEAMWWRRFLRELHGTNGWNVKLATQHVTNILTSDFITVGGEPQPNHQVDLRGHSNESVNWSEA